MKKVLFLSLILGFIVIFGTGASLVQTDGLPSSLKFRFDTSACNDYYFVGTMKDTKIYHCSGYEYGCGNVEYVADGAMHLAGGYAYFGFTTVYNLWDNGGMSIRHVTTNLGTRQGTYVYQYFYSSSGVMSGHGGSGSHTINLGPDPTSAPGAIEGFDENFKN